ncbi:hypothetical protein GGTG_01995 [Gaeumannomyces tritici R3-111a-1]|uniref:Uncharacterized protein n=1 Tax=Gaeumannomyces tritici (strain R3-111a-1) TaxID=644352 RepID=J3NL54_GAET3|nr:hypothetical protein GGTG_01995 [Gaeumannomyces tritici R3-111a-1]EJT82021.1 hypothetical protein GGTG_01995 [Gaeumannomyces tritici R3-111a-1]
MSSVNASAWYYPTSNPPCQQRCASVCLPKHVTTELTRVGMKAGTDRQPHQAASNGHRHVYFAFPFCIPGSSRLGLVAGGLRHKNPPTPAALIKSSPWKQERGRYKEAWWGECDCVWV